MRGPAELLRRLGAGWVLVVVVGPVPVSGPVANDPAGLLVEDRDALVEVSVREEDLVRLLIDEDLGHPAEALQVVAVRDIASVASRAGALFPEPRDDVSVLGEFQDMRVAGAVPADPDEALVIYEDPVVGLGPGVSLVHLSRRRPPGLDDVAVEVKRENGRRRKAAFGAPLHPARFSTGEVLAVDHPDHIAVVHPEADRAAQEPMVGKGLRPEGVYLEHRGLHLPSLDEPIEPALNEP